MSGKLFQCGYGAILNEDVEVLEACLTALQLRPSEFALGDHIKVLEIGMHDGNTARGIERWCHDHYRNIDYFGIDVDDGSKRQRYTPKGGTVIVGDSAESFWMVPNNLDLIWVDGCHCQSHIMLETIYYSGKVRPGGFMCYHDANPLGQGHYDHHQYHGPRIPEFSLAIDAGLKALGFPWPNWRLFMEKYPTEVVDCGTKAFKRIT